MSNNEALRLFRRKKYYQGMEKILIRLKDDNCAIEFSNYMARVALCTHPGKFTSSVIEEKLIDISSKYHIKCNEACVENTILHVITMGYETGGHTRVVERWIEFSDEVQKHSLFITSGKSDVTSRLSKAIADKNGCIYTCNGNNLMDRSLRLRTIASNYDVIVLHIHMYDIVPILAFGTREFKRPVLFYNHADHLFSVGMSVSDLVLDMSMRGHIMSKTRRGIISKILPIPIDSVRESSEDNRFIKEKYLSERKLALNLKVIVSCGAGYKYDLHNEHESFISLINNVLNNNKNIIFIIIGPSVNNSAWRHLKHEHGSRIMITGSVPHGDVAGYLKIADLYIDSYPVGSGTAILEAMSNRIPVISFETVLNAYDIYSDQLVVFNSAEKVIYEKLYSNQAEIVEKKMDFINLNHFEEGWCRKWRKIYNELPRSHSTCIPVDNCDIGDLDVLIMKISKHGCMASMRLLFSSSIGIFARLEVIVMMLYYRELVCILKKYIFRVLNIRKYK